MDVHCAQVVHEGDEILVLAQLPNDTVYSRRFGDDDYPKELLQEQLRMLKNQGFVVCHYYSL